MNMQDDSVNAKGAMGDEELVSVLHDHVENSARKASDKLGGPLCTDNLDVFLNDPSCIRIPTELIFDGYGMEMHQFASPEFVTIDGERRCILHVQPRYTIQPESIPYMVAYMAVAINYGTAATAALCETYGAIVMQLSEDAFYDAICRVADQ